jgi:hypothetical protein
MSLLFISPATFQIEQKIWTYELRIDEVLARASNWQSDLRVNLHLIHHRDIPNSQLLRLPQPFSA